MGGDVHQVDTTSFGLSAHARWPAEQTAPLAERRPVGDRAALAPPRCCHAFERTGGRRFAELLPTTDEPVRLYRDKNETRKCDRPAADWVGKYAKWGSALRRQTGEKPGAAGRSDPSKIIRPNRSALSIPGSLAGV
jgi:hypothetical protein